MGGRRRPQGVGKGGRHRRLLTRSAARGRGTWDGRLDGPKSVACGGDADEQAGCAGRPGQRSQAGARSYTPTLYIVRSPSAVITFA